jgi:hypothetical protein
MKTIHNSLMALAASLLLAPAAYAQTDTPVQYQHEKYALENGVGFNKYLVSQTPNANSEYTLRLETFVTGSVKATAIPTDFVLVLDASGSMKYDYRPGNVTMPKNSFDADWSKVSPYFLKCETDDEYSRLSIYYGYKNGSVGSAGSGSAATASSRVATRSYYALFADENKTTNCSLYYHVESTSNAGYYKIFRRMFDAADGHLLEGPADPSTASETAWKKYSGTEPTGTPTTLSARPATVYYNLAIRLKDNTIKYLNGNGLSDTPYNATATNTIMFVSDGNLYRIQRRGEALMEGVRGFVNMVTAENLKDQWAPNIPARHQIAIVRFSGDYNADHVEDIDYHPSYSTATHVLKDFTDVRDSTAFNTSVKDKYIVSGSTYTDFGMRLAQKLLTRLEGQTGYNSLNTGGGVNRNKVVIFFTDGEPSSSKHSGTTSSSFFGTVTPTLRDGKIVKQVGVGKINGRIYCIDLAMTSSTKDFLKHLSSNYPKGDAKVIGGGYNANNLTGVQVPIDPDQHVGEGDAYEFTPAEYEFLKDEEPNYYKDSNDGDLSSVFASIAQGSTGQQAGDKLVVMDVMSDSFELPANLSGKVKFYTAQCIGEKEIDGEKYLAFAREVPVDEREPLAHLWVGRTEGQGSAAHIVWTDQGAAASGGLDIDQEVRAKKSADGKHITVSGFEFVDLWCGKDEMPEHYSSATNGNTRQMASDDPNAAYAADGYRGFKLIIEFPIVVSPGAVGGSGVPTNNEIQSGFYHGTNDGTAEGDPIINYQKPALTIPVQLAIQKKGLGPNESANFTIQRRTMVEGSEWTDYLSFVLTSTSDDSEPIQRILNLDPDYYYRVKEEGWSWAYSNRAQVEATFPSTEDPTLTNPIVIVNEPIPNPPKHAEAVVRNELKNY